ncbi:hypothetical protein ACS0TY_014714 [Phlomoides rotata]
MVDERAEPHAGKEGKGAVLAPTPTAAATGVASGLGKEVLDPATPTPTPTSMTGITFVTQGRGSNISPLSPIPFTRVTSSVERGATVTPNPTGTATEPSTPMISPAGLSSWLVEPSALAITMEKLSGLVMKAVENALNIIGVPHVPPSAARKEGGADRGKVSASSQMSSQGDRYTLVERRHGEESYVPEGMSMDRAKEKSSVSCSERRPPNKSPGGEVRKAKKAEAKFFVHDKKKEPEVKKVGPDLPKPERTGPRGRYEKHTPFKLEPAEGSRDFCRASRAKVSLVPI